MLPERSATSSIAAVRCGTTFAVTCTLKFWFASVQCTVTVIGDTGPGLPAVNESQTRPTCAVSPGCTGAGGLSAGGSPNGAGTLEVTWKLTGCTACTSNTIARYVVLPCSTSWNATDGVGKVTIGGSLSYQTPNAWSAIVSI